MKKHIAFGLAAVIALSVLLVSALPFLVDVNTFRPMIESRLSAAVSRKVTLGKLSLAAWSGSIVADDLAVAEEPKFGQDPFFTAKRVRIGVQMKPLIFEKRLVVRSFHVEEPRIHLIRGEDGIWNFSSLSRAAGSHNTSQLTTPANLSVGRITIKEGSARIERLPLRQNPEIYSHLNVKLERFSLAAAFPFSVSASLPGDGKVKVSGMLGPMNVLDAAATALDAELTITHLDPVVAGYVGPAAGISMTTDLDTHIVSDGVDIRSKGKLHADHIVLVKGAKAVPYPLDIDYQMRHSLKSNEGEISDIALQTGNVAVHVNGAYQLAVNKRPVFNLKLMAPNLPIDSLQALMPAVGIKLPDGTVLHGGTLSASFTIKGSPQDNVIAGAYEVRNTRLMGYNLGSKIVGVAALGGVETGNNTAIEISRANVRITKSGTESTSIYSVIPALGVSTGSGTISPAGLLNFHLITNVTGAKGLGKLGVSILTKLNNISSALKPSAATGIPITITGTVQNPVITADVSGLLKGNTATLRSKGADILGKTGLPRLFNKKQ